jgi:hypothetical protein
MHIDSVENEPRRNTPGNGDLRRICYGNSMTLEKGDWVQTDTGEVGKIFLVNRVSAFVEISAKGKDSTLVSFLLSRLTKIAPPDRNNIQ